MATYRPVYFEFWQDYDLLDLTPEEKYFYLFLLTNPQTTACGVYSIHPKQIALWTGYHRETVDKLLKRFIELGKVQFNDETNELLVVNWLKYNAPKKKQDNIVKAIGKELESVKTPEFVQFVKSALDGGTPWKGRARGDEGAPQPSEGAPPQHNVTERNGTVTEPFGADAPEANGKSTYVLLDEFYSERLKTGDDKKTARNKTISEGTARLVGEFSDMPEVDKLGEPFPVFRALFTRSVKLAEDDFDRALAFTRWALGQLPAFPLPDGWKGDRDHLRRFLQTWFTGSSDPKRCGRWVAMWREYHEQQLEQEHVEPSGDDWLEAELEGVLSDA